MAIHSQHGEARLHRPAVLRRREKSLLELSLESMRLDVARALRSVPQTPGSAPLDVGFIEQMIEEAHRHEQRQASGAKPT